MLPIATGFAAKNMCSCVFEAHRNPKDIQANELHFSLVKLTKSVVDISNNNVTSTLFGFFKRTAKYDAAIGCMLDYPGEEITGADVPCILDQKKFSADTIKRSQYLEKAKPEDSVWAQIDRPSLQMAIEHAFDQPGEKTKKNTRTVLVIYNGKIVGEKYEVGFNRDTPQLGWSMTKSFMNAWMGILVKQGRINLDDHPDIPGWQSDGRKDIAYRHLLQMNTGLEWAELYGSATDITRMLYMEPDMARYAVSKQLDYEIGEVWNYASGTTLILSGLMKQAELPTPYHCFLNEYLFRPIGMRSATIDMDQSGTYVASSYGFATPEDWARFGLLYLNDGVWDGERLLPEGWVQWTKEEAKGSDGRYGAHFWLNSSGFLPDVPRDMFSANGFQGQRVFILPSHNMVIVRLGHSAWESFDFNEMVSGILGAFDK